MLLLGPELGDGGVGEARQARSDGLRAQALGLELLECLPVDGDQLGVGCLQSSQPALRAMCF
jgi:hypothetical protein